MLVTLNIKNRIRIGIAVYHLINHNIISFRCHICQDIIYILHMDMLLMERLVR